MLQVQTMERLFAETVGRLEDRVQVLETLGPATTAQHHTTAQQQQQQHHVRSHSSGSSNGSSHHRAGSHTGSSSSGPSSGRGLGPYAQRMTGSQQQQQQQQPLLWATRRAAPAAPSSGMRRVSLEPGRPRANGWVAGHNGGGGRAAVGGWNAGGSRFRSTGGYHF